MEVLVFGSAIVDFICYVSRLPKPGETLHGREFTTGFGGKGANQCVAAAKLGAKTAMIAKLGNDTWGENYLQNLKTNGVNVDYVKTVPGATTGIAQINVADSGDNQIVIVAGANDLLSSDDVVNASHLFENSKILICQLETPIQASVAALKQFKGTSILNAAPALEDTPVELLQLASIFCVNECEAALMTKAEVISIRDAVTATRKLHAMGANTVIITLGDQGAVYGRKESPEVVHVATKHVHKVVDTTGAGDSFIGSLAYLLAKYPEQPLHQQIGAACEVAAFSVQYPGTQSSFPTATDVRINFDKEYQWTAYRE